MKKESSRTKLSLETTKYKGTQTNPAVLDHADKTEPITKVKRAYRLLQKLHKRYPSLINLKTFSKPLKVNILDDIMQDMGGTSKTLLRFALRYYCTRTKYLENMISSAHRFGIDGKPAGSISDDEKLYAKEKLSFIQLRVKQNRCK